MTMSLAEMFAELDGHAEPIAIDALVELMRAVDVEDGDLADHIAYRDDRYARNLIRLGSQYAAFCLCWKPGQASPIHDHRGSACGVRVVAGAAGETVYERGDDGLLVQREERTYPVGHVCGSYDNDIHCMYNGSDRDGLVTLHVYTPPLSEINVYEVGSTEVKRWTDEETLLARSGEV